MVFKKLHKVRSSSSCNLKETPDSGTDSMDYSMDTMVVNECSGEDMDMWKNIRMFPKKENGARKYLYEHNPLQVLQKQDTPEEWPARAEVLICLDREWSRIEKSIETSCEYEVATLAQETRFLIRTAESGDASKIEARVLTVRERTRMQKNLIRTLLRLQQVRKIKWLRLNAVSFGPVSPTERMRSEMPAEGRRIGMQNVGKLEIVSDNGMCIDFFFRVCQFGHLKELVLTLQGMDGLDCLDKMRCKRIDYLRLETDTELKSAKSAEAIQKLLHPNIDEDPQNSF